MLKYYFDRVRFSVHVKVWRNLNGLTIKELCELTGLSVNTVMGVESNDNAPHMETFLILCSAMDVNPQEFFKTAKKGLTDGN